MKVYKNRPTQELRIVKPDNGTNDYEIWWVEPVCLGTAFKPNDAQVITQDKQRFRNLLAAAQHLLQQYGKRDFAANMKTGRDFSPRNRLLTGTELIDLGVWTNFKKLRRLEAATDSKMLDKVWSLSPEECSELGLPPEAGVAQ